MRLSVWVRVLSLAFGLVLCATVPARAEYLRAETEHFVIQGDVSRNQITEYARKVERFHEMLELFSPPTVSDLTPPKLWIYLASNNTMLRQAWPNAPREVGGYYSRNDGRIYAVVDLNSYDADAVLFHEYAHHYMFQYHDKANPAWFVEGFAEYFAYSDLRMGQIRYGLIAPGRMSSIDDVMGWIPMDVLLSERPNLSTRREATAYYAQAWLLAHYMLGDPARHAQFSNYLAAVGRGQESVSAFEEYTGQTPAQLAISLRAYRGRGMTSYRLQQALPVAEVTVTPLPPSAREAMWLDLRSLRAKGDDWDALLARVRAMAARYPGDRLAAVTLAKYLVKGDLQTEALSVLEPVIAANPDDVEALWVMASAEMDLAETAADPAARTALVRQAQRRLSAAYQADPMDYRIYMGLLRNREGASNFPTDNDLVIASSAYRLAPQLPSVAMLTAQILMAKEQYPEAVSVLTPLANNPHGGGDTGSLQALLATARERADLPPLAGGTPPPADTAEPDED